MNKTDYLDQYFCACGWRGLANQTVEANGFVACPKCRRAVTFAPKQGTP